MQTVLSKARSRAEGALTTSLTRVGTDLCFIDREALALEEALENSAADVRAELAVHGVSDSADHSGFYEQLKADVLQEVLGS